MPRLHWMNHFAVAPDHGGGTRHFEIGRELVARGWDVTLLASDFNLYSRRYVRRRDARDRRAIAEEVDGVDFRWLWSAPYSRNDWKRGWNWLTFARSLARWSKSAPEPDVVIGSTPHLLTPFVGSRAARRRGVPFVLEVRDLWPESLLAAGGRKGPVYGVMRLMADHLYRRSDRIVALARGTISHLRDRGVSADRLLYVPNGVDLETMNAARSPSRETFTLVYAGAHGAANGLDVVLDAADRLRDEPRIRFRLVGDGPEREGLIAEATDRGLENVRFEPPVPKSDIPRVLSEADAGLMVLRKTPLFEFGVSPNKLFDYFGASLPVVCNVPGEVASMVREAGAGEQADPGSGSSLAEAVLRLVRRSPEERAEMGAAARRWVAREHGRDVLGERLDRALREVVSG